MTTKTEFQAGGHALDHIRNHNEIRVIKLLHKRLENKQGFCGCRICVEDVYAVVMNELKPQYVQQGSVLLHQDPVDQEIIHQIEEAMRKVAVHPNHK